MKNISYLTLAFFTLLLFTECKKEEITDDVQFLTNSYFGDCFFYSASKSDEIVLRDQEEYESYFAALRQSSSNKDCSEAVPTAIDFDKYTLIGHRTSGGGCSVEYDRTLEQKGNKEVTYHITATYSGLCMMLISDMNWALIPKIKNRTDVIFEVEEVHQN
ncbi:MAG: hypothetical protein ACI9AU_000122 [Bacteroidia bacterium]|jgi:hypothetical protein